jgi:hypothetical protein
VACSNKILPEREALLSAAEILAEDDKALSRLRNHFRYAFAPERHDDHEIINYDE